MSGEFGVRRPQSPLSLRATCGDRTNKHSCGSRESLQDSSGTGSARVAGSEGIDAGWSAYVAVRRSFYVAERRWAGTPFWRRRS
jgi:hypothetical protein